MQNINEEINIEVKYSHKNYDSTMAPFFRNNLNNDDNNSNSITEVNNLDIIEKFKLLFLPREIIDFYIDHQLYDKELYYKNVTILPINKILELQEQYNNDGINNIVDIGYIYAGMGWIKVFYYHKNFDKLFIRNDGGSNCYDRLENYNNLKKISNYKIIDEMENGPYNFIDLFSDNFLIA